MRMAKRRVSSCQDLRSGKEDMDDSALLQSPASHDPERNRLLDFHMEPVNKSASVRRTRSASTQSIQLRNSDWVDRSASSRRHVLRPAVPRFISSEVAEELRRMNRAMSSELQQAKISNDKLRASYELKLQKLKGENEELKRENEELKGENEELQYTNKKLQNQVDYFYQLTTPQPETTSISAITPPAEISRTRDDPLTMFSDELFISNSYNSNSDLPGEGSQIVCSKFQCLLHFIPINGELVTMASPKLFRHLGIANPDIIPENLCIDVH